MNDLAEGFWLRVKGLLSEKKFTQEMLANKAGIDFNNLKQQIFHKRMPTADIAVSISKVLGTSVEYLVTGSDTNPLQEKVDRLEKQMLAMKQLAIQITNS